MMKRETLLAWRKRARDSLQYASTRAEMLALCDHGLEALEQLAGGPSVLAQREELTERERQLKLALKDLRAGLNAVLDNIPADLEPAVVQGAPLIRDLQRTVLTVELMEEMLKAKGPAWRRQWDWYTPRLEEEFS